MELSQELVVAVPLDRVVQLLSDPDHPFKWQKELVSIDRLKGEPGEAGSKAKLSYKSSSGREFVLEETVVTHELPGESVSKYETSGMKHTVTTNVEAVDAGHTKVTVETAMTLTGMAKFAAPLLEKTLREQVETRGEDLGRYLESV